MKYRGHFCIAFVLICTSIKKINANLGKRIGGYGSYFYFNLYMGIMIVSLDRMYMI